VGHGGCRYRRPVTEPDLRDDGQRAAWRNHLAGLFRGRRVICGIAPLAAFEGWVDLLLEAGAQRPLLVANGMGAGPVPAEERAERVFVDVPPSPTMSEELRAQDALARALPDEVVSAVERYDPTGEAVWMVGPFIGTDPILGRPVIGGRPAAWVALEDKIVVDDVWDAVQAPRAPSTVVPVDPAALRTASRSLDRGSGVVLAGDARDGFNGGGEFVRWVHSETDLLDAVAFYGPRCDRVRVMPFLDGVPCSIHGLVLPDATAAFRPVELAILRGRDRRFVYGGQGSTWDPPQDDRAEMRDLVRRTGEELRARVGYRGAFGIDGVLTADGFRPTEINTRFSGGLASLARGVDSALFTLLQLNVLAGRDPQVDGEALEAWAVAAMDASRVCRAVAVVPQRLAADPFDIHVSWDGHRLSRRWEPTGWQVSVGSNPVGTFARLVAPDAELAGVRVALLNCALMAFLDAELGSSIGPVDPAPEVRT